MSTKSPDDNMSDEEFVAIHLEKLRTDIAYGKYFMNEFDNYLEEQLNQKHNDENIKTQTGVHSAVCRVHIQS